MGEKCASLASHPIAYDYDLYKTNLMLQVGRTYITRFIWSSTLAYLPRILSGNKGTTLCSKPTYGRRVWVTKYQYMLDLSLYGPTSQILDHNLIT